MDNNGTNKKPVIVKNYIDEKQNCVNIPSDESALVIYYREKRRALITELKGLDGLLGVKTHIETMTIK